MTSATTWAQSTDDIGKVLAADGKMYKTVAAATNAGTTASGIIAYWGAAGSVETGNSTYKGMAIAIEDASLNWGEHPNHTNYCSSDNHQCSTATAYCSTVSSALNAKNGIAATLSARDRNGSGHWHNAPCNGYNVARPSGASIWAIPSMGQWNKIAQGLTGKSTDLSSTQNPEYSYDKLSAKITAAGGSTLRWLFYWSSTEVSASNVYIFDIGGINSTRNGSYVRSYAKNTDNEYTHVRMFFAFSSAAAAVYTISYNANGGSGAPSSQTKDGGIDLTLSSTVPTRTGYAFAGWNTKADGSGTSYASGATFTGNADTMLYAQWTFQGSGTAENPYLIPSADVWNYLADKVNNGTNYSGKFFRQAEDISVSTMVGATSSHKFSGTYDGNGHTLTVNYNSTAQYAAPFSYADGATFKNLHIAGSITSSAKYVASFVGYSYGSNTFLNCRSSVAITSSITGDGTHGGFVGILEGDNVSDYTVTFEGCVFNGKLLGSNTTNCGGFVGWSQTHRKIRINLSNCLYAPQEVTISISGCQTFSRGQVLSDIFSTNTNNYYIESLGGTQGKQACSISAGDDVTINNLGDGTEYNVSGITAYAHGIKYGGTFYAGNGDVVSLNLSHNDNPGSTFSHYVVTGGGSFDDATSNTPTLTMTNANQVINARWAHTLSQATDNSTFISANNGLVYDITLGRTMNAGGWNTFCVPFDISSSQITSKFGAGTLVRTLGSSAFNSSTKELTLNFTKATSIQAGKPYLVYLGRGSNVVNPTFEDVTIVSGTTTKTTTYANFMPVMNPTSLTGGDKSILFVTGGDKLTYPSSTGNINGFRAYFQLHDLPTEARSFAMSFEEETTSIELKKGRIEELNSFFDLQGRKVEKPTKGLYIVNGKKTIIK